MCEENFLKNLSCFAVCINDTLSFAERESEHDSIKRDDDDEKKVFKKNSS
jgi:hypothetical protein